MRELVRSQLGHYIDRVDSQIELSGEPMRIPPDAAQHIGMALHELATNAAKYGALSTPEGKVHISWDIMPGPDGTPMCHLSWKSSAARRSSGPRRADSACRHRAHRRARAAWRGAHRLRAIRPALDAGISRAAYRGPLTRAGDAWA